MGSSSHTPAAPWVFLQIGVFTLASMALTLFPPAHGRLLLVPLAADAPVARLAVDRGALVLGRGRGGTILVRGDAARLAGPLLRSGILTLAGWPADCGAFPVKA